VGPERFDYLFRKVEADSRGPYGTTIDFGERERIRCAALSIGGGSGRFANATNFSHWSSFRNPGEQQFSGGSSGSGVMRVQGMPELFRSFVTSALAELANKQGEGKQKNPRRAISDERESTKVLGELFCPAQAGWKTSACAEPNHWQGR
jgi:hypothetical protein